MAWTTTGTQSGTDTSLASITSVTGVLVNVSANGHRTYQVPTTVTLLTITGTLSWDSDYETLECSESTRIEINAGATTTIGAATTINSKTRYSKGTGLIMNKQQSSPFINTSSCNVWVKASTSLALGGKLIVNGSRIMSGGGIFLGNSTTPSGNFVTLTLNGSVELQNISTTQNMQMIRAFCEVSGINVNSATIDGRTIGGLPFSSAGWNTFAMSLAFGNFQCDGNGATAPVTVPNATLANNVNNFDYAYVANANDKTRINKYIFKNSDVGSGLRTLGQTGTTWRLGVVEFIKNVIFSVSNTSGTALENAVVYSKLLGATLNPSSGSRYDGIDNYTTPRVYINSTASTGLTTATDILYAVAQGYATDATNAGTALTMDSLTTKTNDVHDANYIWSYNHLVGQPSTSMRGTGTLTQAWTLFTDTDVTLSRTSALALIGTKFTFNTTTKKIVVIANATYDDLYDANKAYKCSTTQAQIEAPLIGQTIVTTNGTDLQAYTGWTLEVATGIILSSGTKFNKVIFDTVTLTGTGEIQGVYQNSVGTSTTLQITGFDANSAVYIEDNTAVQKYYSASATGTVTLYIPPTATGTWYYAVEKYGNQRQSDFFTFSGGLKTIVVKALTDTGITVTNQTTVGAYTSLGTPDKVYDYVAYLRLSTPHISYGQIVFKNGTSLDLQDASMLINQSFSSVASFNFTTKLLTIKSTSYAIGSTFEKTITTPPETIEADTTEVITCPIEDANGDSSLTIQGGSGNFTLWKITNATAEDDYATGTNLGTVGNVTFRFLQASGYKIVVRDNTTSFRQVVPMDKGIYTTGLFFGDQVQLAQSAEVTLINNKVDVIALDLNIVNNGVQKASKFIPHNQNL